MKQFKGSMVALVTPFHEDGSVNYDKLGELLDLHVEQKTDGILVLGTTGEPATMSDEEQVKICDYAVKRVNGRVPVFAGSGTNCTEHMLKKSLKYQELGADGLLLISPYYNKTNTEGMYRHFAEVADKVSIPSIVYNVPGRTGCNIPESVVARLAKHPNIMGIKEASGDISYVAKIARYVSEDFVLLSGNDDMIVPVLSLGGSGVISVYANIMPRQTHDIVFDYLEGRREASLQAQLKYLDLINALFCEVNPIPVKEAMNLMGMQVGPYRLPLYPMAEDNQKHLRRVMEESGLL